MADSADTRSDDWRQSERYGSLAVIEQPSPAFDYQRELYEAHKLRRARWAAFAYERERTPVKKPKPVLALPKPEKEPLPANLPVVKVKVDFVGPRQPLPLPAFRIARIQELVARKFGIRRGELIGKSRFMNITTARAVAFFLLREITQHSLPEIGRRCGGRDHSTVLHGVRKIAFLIGEPAPKGCTKTMRERPLNPEIARKVAELREEIAQ